MRALTVIPGQANSLDLTDWPEPGATPELILARALAIGVCGTDREIAAGAYGSAPPGGSRLIIGHESLAEVVAAPGSSAAIPGDLIVGIVRRPDPVPCPNCAVGEWDMCSNGLYTERGIKASHGYGAELFTIEPEFAVKLDRRLARTGALLEPASIVAKAWDHIERIGARAHWRPQSVLVTGAGTVGMLAAMMGVRRGLDVTIYDRVTEGIKPVLAGRLGARYVTGDLSDLSLRPDIIVECTGSAALIVGAMGMTGPAGIICLAGLSSGRRPVEIPSELLGRTMVLENDVVFGSVNANRRHYAMAARELADADDDWLNALITRRLPLTAWRTAFTEPDSGVKTIIEFSPS